MIREIRTLTPADQNRLRDDHRRSDGDDFSRYLRARADQAAEEAGESFKDTPSKSPRRQPPFIRNDAMWADFFAHIGESGVNDSRADAPLFSWGEKRENARRHTELARQSASLKGTTPLHILNEKI